MPGHWQLRELAGAYVYANGRCLNVSSEPARQPTGLERPARRLRPMTSLPQRENNYGKSRNG